MFGALAKTYYAEKAGIDPKDIVSVSIMPCAAKKFECDRPEMADSGFKDVDYVLTTREAAQMMKEAGIDLPNLPDERVRRSARNIDRRGGHLRQHRRRYGSRAFGRLTRF